MPEEPSKLKIIDSEDIDSLVLEALNQGDVLAVREETSQMLINVHGVSINAKPRSDGRYQGYLSADGTPKYFYGKSREEVAKKITEYIRSGAKPQRKKANQKKDYSLSDWLDKWLELYKTPSLKPTSIENVINSLVSVRKNLGNKKLSNLSPMDVQTFFAAFPPTRMRNLTRTNLNQALKKAAMLGFIKTNPCESLELKKHRAVKRKALTQEQQALFLLSCRSSKYENILCFLLGSGLRIGEALALTWSDIDQTQKTVSIDKNAVFIKGERVVQSMPKTEAGVRVIPLTNMALQALQPMPVLSKSIIFQYTYNAIRLYLAKLSVQLNFKVTAHILRHTFSTRLEEAGIPPKLKQYILGHATLEMTQGTYTDIQQAYVMSQKQLIHTAFDIGFDTKSALE